MQEVERLTYSVSEAARALGVSRTFIYELARQNAIRHIRLGKRVLIPRDTVCEMLAGAPSA